MAAHGRSTVAAVLVAAGSGARLGADRPKAFVEVAGRALLQHAAERFLTHPDVRDVVVAVPPERLDAAAALVPRATVVAGGHTRQRSVDLALGALADDVEVVLVHDVARAFVPSGVISAVVAAVRDDVVAAVPVVPVTDTLRRSDAGSGLLGELVDRGALAAMQTPQGFRRDVLVRAHRAALSDDATDDAALVQALGGRVAAVPGDERAFKITVPLDLALAEVVARDG